MPANSKKQQRFMGLVYAVQKGEIKAPSKEVEEAAKSMSEEDVRDFAKTKHKDLPEKAAALFVEHSKSFQEIYSPVLSKIAELEAEAQDNALDLFVGCLNMTPDGRLYADTSQYKEAQQPNWFERKFNGVKDYLVKDHINRHLQGIMADPTKRRMLLGGGGAMLGAVIYALYSAMTGTKVNPGTLMLSMGLGGGFPALLDYGTSDKNNNSMFTSMFGLDNEEDKQQKQTGAYGLRDYARDIDAGPFALNNAGLITGTAVGLDQLRRINNSQSVNAWREMRAAAKKIPTADIVKLKALSKHLAKGWGVKPNVVMQHLLERPGTAKKYLSGLASGRKDWTAPNLVNSPHRHAYLKHNVINDLNNTKPGFFGGMRSRHAKNVRAINDGNFASDFNKMFGPKNKGLFTRNLKVTPNRVAGGAAGRVGAGILGSVAAGWLGNQVGEGLQRLFNKK